jgi:hypothetical protein
MKYSPKILKLAEIFEVPPSSIIMDENTFNIEEIYCDKTGQTHYKIVLLSGETIIEKTKKP